VVQTHRQSLPPAEIGTAQPGANSVYFVVLDGKQHSVHFSREAADNTAWELSYEVHLQQPPVDGQEEISVLSFTEMMESPVEMVI
jgi:hypothetical protein